MEIAVAVTYHPDLDRYLLLKRSSSMSVFPQRWNFPSGPIEDQQPKNAACRELTKETGLDGTVKKRAAPFGLDESSYTFTIYPFLIHVQDATVTLNVEHDQYRWVKDRKIKTFDTVPALWTDLERLDLV
ncbi:MAG: NUDIX domain-containing protein [Candidatus Nanohaloarchaeota archaeon QJJ-5]|nr:NUDIX domain-containing protein [Candidatus Nanohaloarchaeota archaeon QJJ-5]